MFTFCIQEKQRSYTSLEAVFQDVVRHAMSRYVLTLGGEAVFYECLCEVIEEFIMNNQSILFRNKTALIKEAKAMQAPNPKKTPLNQLVRGMIHGIGQPVWELVREQSKTQKGK